MTSVTRSSRSRPITPSLIPVSIASRCSTSPRISTGSRPEGLALDPARDEQRPGDPDDPGQPQVGQQVRHRGEQALAQARVRLPDRGGPTTCPVCAPVSPKHRDLRDHRAAAGPVAVAPPTAGWPGRRAAPSRAGSRVFATTTPSASAISTNDTPDRLCTPSAIGRPPGRCGRAATGATSACRSSGARGQVLRRRQRAGALGAPEVDLRLGQRHAADADEHDRDDAELQGQQLPRDRPPPRHRGSPFRGSVAASTNDPNDRYHRHGRNRDLDRHPAVSSASRNRRRRGERCTNCRMRPTRTPGGQDR